MTVRVARTNRFYLFVLIIFCIYAITFVEYSPNDPIRITEETASIITNHEDHNTDQKDNDVINERNDFNLQSLNISFVENMWDSETKRMNKCNPNQYKYTTLLIKDLIAANLDQYRTKTTSSDIENDYLEWKNMCWNQTGRHRKQHCYFWYKKVRIQIINHKLYISATPYEIERHIYDPEGYRTGLFFYLCHLLRKYAQYLPDTDFIWYYHDYKKNILSRWNWKINGNIPYFFSDYNLAHLQAIPASNLLLFSISRSYLKYRYFAGIKSAWNLRNAKNYRRIADYMYWLKVINNKTLTPLLNWDNKTINKALFRGANNARARDQLYKTLIENTYIHDTVTKEYFDVQITEGYALAVHKNTAVRLSLVEQLDYRYIIVLDGISVRDSLLYQMKMGAVILKQLSANYEWWYFDVVDGYHWIIFENISHLMAIVINLVDEVEGYYKSQTLNGALTVREYKYLLNHSMTAYTYDALREITENSKKFMDEYLDENNVDCWFIHMIQIYNEYLFDVDSIQKSPDEYMRHLPADAYQ